MAQDREVDGSVLFQIGLAATGASQQPGLADDQRKALLDEAIGAFLTMLIDRPGLVRVRLDLALAPDTNIGGTSDERIIHIDIGGQRLPFRRDAEDLTTSGIGVSVWTGGELWRDNLGERGGRCASLAVCR